jgi:hypothetical protein
MLCFQAPSHICKVPMHAHALNKRTTKWNFTKLYIREFYKEFSSHFNFGYLGKNNTSLGNLNAYLCAPPAHMAHTRVFQLTFHMCLRSPPVQEFCCLKHTSSLPLDVRQSNRLPAGVPVRCTIYFWNMWAFLADLSPELCRWWLPQRSMFQFVAVSYNKHIAEENL